MTVIIGKPRRAKQLVGTRFLALCVLAAALHGAAARADSLDVGKELYHALDYDQARVALRRATSLGNARRRAEAYLYLGLIDTVEGDEVAARQRFREGLALDLDIDLPLGTSPKVARLFDVVKAEVARAAPPRAHPPAALPPAAAGVAPAPDAVASRELSGGPPRRHSGAGRWVAGTLFVLGVAAAGTAIAYGLQESSAEAAFKSAHFQSDALAYQKAANQDALVADVLYGAGALVGFTGLGLWFAF